MNCWQPGREYQLVLALDQGAMRPMVWNCVPDRAVELLGPIVLPAVRHHLGRGWYRRVDDTPIWHLDGLPAHVQLTSRSGPERLRSASLGYEAQARGKGVMLPITIVVYRTGHVRLADGNHRLTAFRLLAAERPELYPSIRVEWKLQIE